MKKCIAIFCFIVFISDVSAQARRGQTMLGGSFSYASTTQEVEVGDDYTVKTFHFAPNFGYFLARQLALGVRFNTTLTKSESSKVNTYLGAPFLRVYLANASSKVNFLLDGSYSVGILKTHSIERKMDGYGVSAGPVIFLRETVGLEILGSYGAERVENGPWTKTIRGAVGIQVHLGYGKFKRSKKDGDEDDEWLF